MPDTWDAAIQYVNQDGFGLDLRMSEPGFVWFKPRDTPGGPAALEIRVEMVVLRAAIARLEALYAELHPPPPPPEEPPAGEPLP